MTWSTLTVIPDEFYRDGCKLCCVEDNIYLVGGFGDNRVTEYSLSYNTWRNLGKMQEKRNGANVCTLDSKIFAMGGVDTTCEMLDPLDQSEEKLQWKYIASMAKKHNGGGVVVINNKIYVLGGYSDKVEVYDVDQGINS